MTATAKKNTATKPAATKPEAKATRTRYKWTDELKKEISDKLAAAPRGGRDEVLDAYSTQTGVNPASIYAVVNAYRNKGASPRGAKNMSAVDRLAALQTEAVELQAQVVSELQAEHAANLARNTEIEAELAAMGADLTPAPEAEEAAAE